MRAWLQHHRISLVKTFARLLASPFSTLLNVLAIGVALALPVGAFCLLGNLETMSQQVSVEPQLSVFLSANVAKSEIADIASRLKGSAGVLSVRFVSREDAIAELKRVPGMEDVVATLRRNPLPDAFVVTLSTRDSAVVDRLEREFKSFPKVAHVQGDSLWARRLDALLHLGRTAIVLLSIVICVALVAVTFNTIRLQILTQQEEIEVCCLVGATRAYIQRPFLYLGSLLGMLGGCVALAIVLTTANILNSDLAQLATLYGADLQLRLPEMSHIAFVFGACTSLGWLGAYWSVSRHLLVFERR